MRQPFAALPRLDKASDQARGRTTELPLVILRTQREAPCPPRSYEVETLNRPYEKLAASLAGLSGNRNARMQSAVDALWDALHVTGVSWVGFYTCEGGEELVLAPRRDKPACSPIGLHGACGQAFTLRRPLVVRDVSELGDNYIACDSRDRSEVVLPLFDESGTCWGVLDLDSHALGAFDDSDVQGLQSVLVAAALTRADPPATR